MTERRSRLDDIGDLDAPPGSELWARAVHGEIRITLKNTESSSRHLRMMLDVFQRHQGYRHLLDNGGQPFPSFEAYCSEHATPDVPDVPDTAIGNREHAGLERVWERAEPPARRYVVEGLLPEKAATWVFAGGGVGKSLTIAHLLTHVAMGAEWLGLATVRGPVLFIDAELEVDEFTRRAYRIARGLELTQPPEGLHYYRLPGPLDSAQVAQHVQAIIDDLKPVVTVLDSAQASVAGHDMWGAGEVTGMVKAVLDDWGNVLVIDHHGKQPASANLSDASPYGSVFKTNLARSVLQLVSADGGGLSLRQRKHNFGPLRAPLNLAVTFDDDAVTIERIADDDDRMAGIDQHLPAVERTLRELSQYLSGARVEQLAEALDRSTSTVRNHLSALRSRGLATSDGNGIWRATKAFPIPDPLVTGNRELTQTSLNGALQWSRGSRDCKDCGGDLWWRLGDAGLFTCAACTPPVVEVTR